MGAVEVHLALDVLIDKPKHLGEKLVAGLEPQHAPAFVCGGRRLHRQLVHDQPGDLELDRLAVGVCVISLTVLLNELERCGVHGGTALLIAHRGTHECRRRLPVRFDQQRFQLVHVATDQVLAQGEGIALHDGKPYLHRFALWKRPHVILGLILRRGPLDRTALERNYTERDSVNVNILFGEQPGLGIGHVIHSAQASPHHLLAEQLAAERAHSQDLGHVVRIPSFGEHGNRHDAAHVLARLAGLADRGHDLPQFLCGLLLLLVRVFALGLREQLRVDPDRTLFTSRV